MEYCVIEGNYYGVQIESRTIGPRTILPHDNSAHGHLGPRITRQKLTLPTVCAPHFARQDFFYCYSPSEPHLELWAGAFSIGRGSSLWKTPW